MGHMAVNEAARSSGNCSRAKTRTRVNRIVSDWERGTFWAGVLLAISYVLMGVLGAMFGW